MAKYTEAFCVTTGSMISIMQMRSEYNHDPAIYEKVYKGHLFCPGCQAVSLTVVHTNGQLYYRGHPHEEHADGCWYALDERVVKSVTEINGDSEEQALSQLGSLLRATFNGNQQAANARAANRNANRSNAPVVHQQQEARKRLPQCRIEDLLLLYYEFLYYQLQNFGTISTNHILHSKNSGRLSYRYLY